MVLSSSQWWAATGASGYTIENAILLNSENSANMSKTFGADGGDTWTYSGWIKRGKLSHENAYFFSCNSTNGGLFGHTSADDAFRVYTNAAADDDQLHRDPSAWMHICVKCSSGTLTSYVNGVAAHSVSSVTDMNTDTQWTIGDISPAAGNHYDGYMAEVIWIDGTALEPTSFAETDTNGVWVPIDPSGLDFSGTNSFHLDFAVAPGTGNGAGTDVSGNDNHFTDSNLTASDQVSDTPTDSAADDIGNYATGNPLWDGMNQGGAAAPLTLSNGNLVGTSNGTTTRMESTLAIPGNATGKYYFAAEVTAQGAGSHSWQIGIKEASGETSGGASILAYDGPNQTKYDETGSGSAYGDAWGLNDEVGLLLDMDADTLTGYVEGVSQGTMFTSVSTRLAFPVTVRMSTNNISGDQWTLRFDPATFENAAPSGSQYWNTANLPAPAITDPSAYYQNHQYTGTGSAHDETFTGNSSMDPDLVWIKNMDQTDEHKLVDSVRGATQELNSDSTNAESTDSNGVDDLGVTNGFGLGSGANGYNDSGEDFIAWCLKADPTAGFAIKASISHTQGTPTNVAHGLSATPTMAFIKRTDSTGGWYVYHKSLADTTNGHLWLDTSATEQTLTGVWGAHDATNFIIGGGASAIPTGTYVCYIWTDTTGLFATGTYTGNESTDGPFVYTGHLPARVTIKGGSEWHTGDAARSPYNVVGSGINLGDTGTAPATVTTMFDFVATGFKLRTTNGGYNGLGTKYFWFSWAQAPLGGSGVAQAKAR